MNDVASILIVDDQPSNLLALEAMLSGLGGKIVLAGSGPDALRCLLNEDFAVILLDVQMPEMDGYETAGLIRERERSRHTPIIFVTAHSRTEANIFRGYSLGAVDYLFKPVDPEVLQSKVQFFVELFRKNEQIRRQAAALSSLSRQNELILTSAADGVLGVSADGTATFANPAAARMLGWDLADIVGNGVHDLLHPHRGDEVDPEHCPILAALEGDATYTLRDEVFVRKDGTTFPVEFSITPMRTPRNDHPGFVMIFRNVTERRAAAEVEEKERLYEQARAASKAKDDFLATLSHELRTPMTSILGWLEMLSLEPEDSSLREEALEVIRESARHQAQLIDDMLDVSKIILGKFHLEMQETPLGEIVDSAVDAVRPVAAKKGITVETEFQDANPVVRGDAIRLKQVFWNLLTNAIKFTDEGGRVVASLSCRNGASSVSVSDTGVGIDPADLNDIFERLLQGDEGKRQGGLGLGLAIVRHIVEAHGGRVEAQSDGLGKGSTFRVELPTFQSAIAGTGHPEARTDHRARA